MVGLRRKARIAALQTLYEIDCSSHESEEVLARSLQEKDFPEDAACFVRGLVYGVLQNKDAIDNTIRRFAPLFPVEQIVAVDRNVLRLAIFEILFDTTVPVKAAANEAIELAKSFGGETSQKFINGVLGAVIADYELKKKDQELIKSG